MPTIISTLTEPQKYTEWDTTTGTLPNELRSVIVNGGHGKADQRTIVTPIGVATNVTDDELEFLLKNSSFKRHMEAGFIEVVKKKGVDPETVVANMSPADGSAPKTEADFDDGSDAGAVTAQPQKAKVKK